MLGYKGRKKSKPWRVQTCDTSPETRFMDLTAFQSTDLLLQSEADFLSQSEADFLSDSEAAKSSIVIGAACSDGFLR